MSVADAGTMAVESFQGQQNGDFTLIAGKMAVEALDLTSGKLTINDTRRWQLLRTRYLKSDWMLKVRRKVQEVRTGKTLFLLGARSHLQTKNTTPIMRIVLKIPWFRYSSYVSG